MLVASSSGGVDVALGATAAKHCAFTLYAARKNSAAQLKLVSMQFLNVKVNIPVAGA